MKTIINENILKNIIKESIKKCLMESYGQSEIFEDSPELNEFEKLVYKFTLCDIEKNDYSDEPYFDNFIDGMGELYNMSVEYQDYIKYGFEKLYKQAISQGDEDLFWNNDNVINYEYIDSFIYHIDDWKQMMPNPEDVKRYIEMFADWLNNYTESQIEIYSHNKWKEYKSCISKINDII